MSNTERARFTLTVKETGTGVPWLMFEPFDSNLEVLGNGFLGLRLPAGTSYEKAQEIARFINQNVESVTYTKL